MYDKMNNKCNSNKTKIYRFDEQNIAINPDVYTHILEASKKGRRYALKLTLSVAKTKTGFVAGASLQNVGADYNSLVGKRIDCYYYNVSYFHRYVAISNVLIQLIRHTQEHDYPNCMIKALCKCLVTYIEYDWFDNDKIG